MADTQPLAPTDAEIFAVAREAGLLPDNSHPAPETRAARKHSDAVRAFARAALAKWGAQPVACEPVACGNCGGTGWMVRDPDIGTDQECFVCDGSGRYSESATPQPTQTQAGAVPLNHKNIEPVRRFLADRGIYLSDETTKALITVSHSIKGGQHGTE